MSLIVNLADFTRCACCNKPFKKDQPEAKYCSMTCFWSDNPDYTDEDDEANG